MSTTNEGSSSTTFEWRLVKMSRRRTATGEGASKRLRWHHLPRRNPRDAITISVKLRGGAEAWVEVKGRNGEARYPGHVAIIDVVLDINNAH